MSAVAYGPTWERDQAGAFVLPERTLGWDVLGWASKWLEQPDGPDAGRPWRFTDEQARFVLWWYALDGDGKWVFPYGTLRRVKGWGKDPVGAVLSAVEFVGPCRFGGWDAGGEPVAEPHPAAWVQVAAVSKEQTRNTMTLFPRLFSKAALSEYGIDLGKEIIYSRSGGRIEAVTSSPKTLEGGRPTFALKNETQHWLSSNDGLEMAAVIERNAVKSRDGSSRALAITNAHAPGQASDAERDWEAFLAHRDGRAKGDPILYDSLEAPPDTDLRDEEELRAGIRAARGDSWWLDEDRTLQAVWDPRTPVSTSRRFYLNQIAASEDSLFAPHEWAASGVSDLALEVGDEVTLGFDGSKSDDSTALVAVRLSDGLGFLLAVWEKPEGAAGNGWEVPREAVDGAVRQAFDRYQVAAMFADVHPWESYVDAWSAEFGDRLSVSASPSSAVGFDMRTRTRDFTQGVEKLQSVIEDGGKVHVEDPVLTRHALNARRRPNRFGVSFGKEHRESARKVDALAAFVLARLAADKVRAGGGSKRPSSRWVGV